jgi:MFS family permease
MTERLKQTLRDSAPMRWLVLVLVSALLFSTYWFQDFLSGLRTLMETQMGITAGQFGTIIGMTTIANTFGMIILGGIFLDRFGARWTAIVFGSVAVAGGVITAIGAAGLLSNDPGDRILIMGIGRAVFGVGLETTCVLVNRTIVKWFKGYELALAMAINIGFGRLGTALGIAISPVIAGHNPSAAINLAAFLIALGVLFYFIYLIFDVRLDRQHKAGAAGDEDEKFRFSDLVKLVTNPAFILIALLCVAFYSAVFPFIQYAPGILINKFGFSYQLPESARISLFGSTTLGSISIYVAFFIFAVSVSSLPVYIKSKIGRYLVVMAAFLFLGLYLFSVRAQLAIWLHNGPNAAGLIPLGTILFTPIFGRLIDKRGKAASMMMIGAFLLIFAHISLSLFQSELLGYLGLLSLGVAFSLVPAAMWPSVARIVPENRLGTAFATMFTVQNWGLGLLYKGIGWFADRVNPTVVSKIAETRAALTAQGLSADAISDQLQAMLLAGTIPRYNYTKPVLMLAGLGIVSIVLAFYLRQLSERRGYGLEQPSNH